VSATAATVISLIGTGFIIWGLWLFLEAKIRIAGAIVVMLGWADIIVALAVKK
jgi:hypothetical protein